MSYKQLFRKFKLTEMLKPDQKLAAGDDELMRNCRLPGHTVCFAFRWCRLLKRKQQNLI